MYCTLNLCHSKVYDTLKFCGKVQITQFSGFIGMFLVDHKILILLAALAPYFSSQRQFMISNAGLHQNFNSKMIYGESLAIYIYF
jgi:hypothetical protein